MIRALALASDLLWTKRTTKLGREITCPYVFADVRVARKKTALA